LHFFAPKAGSSLISSLKSTLFAPEIKVKIHGVQENSHATDYKNIHEKIIGLE